jgi:hypothetical protein
VKVISAFFPATDWLHLGHSWLCCTITSAFAAGPLLPVLVL